MNWTTPDDVKAQVMKLWRRGLMLASLAGGESVFPKRLTLKGPDSKALSDRFPEVRDWIARLTTGAGHYRIAWNTVRHRVLGVNQIPSGIWIDTLDDALALIGKRSAAGTFVGLVAQTRDQQPLLVPWLIRRPLRALDLASDWPQLLAIVAWLRAHPRPSVYVRQIDLSGVHTKLIETHRAVLAELFDLVLPAEAVDKAHTGLGGFCRRYGFLDKPLRVRLRILDPAIRLLKGTGAQDIAMTQDAFVGLDPPVSTVFITENEINFLAFPPVPRALVVFGAGYGFENLAAASWLPRKDVWYWGDIDTHGFAILNQLRGILPHTVSLLMDLDTLLSHRTLWGREPRQETAPLQRLSAEESLLYDQLRQNHWGDRVRLEQERIGFDHLRNALGTLTSLG